MNRKGGLFSQERAKQYVSHTDSSAANQIQAILTSSLRKAAGRPLVTVCIGTDRSTGDSLGPLVGTKLENEFRQIARLRHAVRSCSRRQYERQAERYSTST